MPDDDFLSDDEEQGLDPNIRAELREARKQRKELEATRAEAEAAKREAAFAKAGVPDTPLAAQLAKTYDGENDPASVKAFFENLGVDLSTGSTGADSGTSDAELAEQRRVAELGAQGTPGGDIRFEDAINSAKNVEEVMDLLASAPEGATDYDGRRIGAPRIE